MDNVINFVSNNYIWFIVAGAILLVVALVLLLVKKSPVKEETKVETKEEKPTVESIVDAVPTEETETLDIEEVQEPTTEPQVGEVNIQTEELNTDSTSTSDDDIWKF